MSKFIFYCIIFFLVTSPTLAGQQPELKRDPFIPLIDGKGNIRKDFKKPVQGQAAQVTLMGISKINNVFYAIIDGEMVKEGDMIKDLKVEKIAPDRVTVYFGERKFELILDTEGK